MTYYVDKTASGWRWKLLADNHQTIASGEGYHNKVDCVHAVNLLKASFNAPVIEYGQPRPDSDYYEHWNSTNNHQYYWHFNARNHKTIAQSEGYTTKQSCVHAIDLVKASYNARIVDASVSPAVYV